MKKKYFLIITILLIIFVFIPKTKAIANTNEAIEYNDDLKYIDDGWSITIIAANTDIVEITVPSRVNGRDVNKIAGFENCSKLKKITLPKTITEIESNCFKNCVELTDVIFLADSCTEIKDGAFLNCTKLTNINKTNNVKYIGQNAFKNCQNLKGINLNSIMKIGYYAFEGCTSLTKIEIPHNYFYNQRMRIEGYAFKDCTSLSDVIIESDTEFYPDLETQCFYGCTSLKNVTLGDSIKELGNYMFQNCTSLENIKLPSNLQSIAMGSFMGCSKLKNIYIHKNIAAIGKEAFYGCTALERVEIIGSKNISSDVFYECDNLNEVYLTADCTLENSSNIFSGISDKSKIKIYGYSGTFAQELAQKQTCQFIPVQKVEKINVTGNKIISKKEDKLTISIAPQNAYYKDVIITSANPQVATVNEDGTINIWAEGTCKIRVIPLDGSNAIGEIVIHTAYEPWGQPSGPTYSLTVKGTENYKKANELLNLINAKRKEYGAPELKMDIDLQNYSMICAKNKSLYDVDQYLTLANGKSMFTLSDKIWSIDPANEYTNAKDIFDKHYMKYTNTQGNIEYLDWTSIGIGAFDIGNKTFWIVMYGKDTLNPVTKVKSNVTNKTKIDIDRNYIRLALKDEYVQIKVGDKYVPQIMQQFELDTWVGDEYGNYTEKKGQKTPIELDDFELSTDDSSIIISKNKEIVGNEETRFGEIRDVIYTEARITLTKSKNSNEIGITQKVNVKWPYTDVKTSSWYYPAVKYVHSNKIMTGSNSSLFEPNNKLTRGMLATIIYKMEGTPEVTETSKFKDVKDSSKYYYKAVVWAEKNRIVSGNKDGTFNPTGNITRQELAIILYNYTKNYKKKAVTLVGDLTKFKDYKQVSSYALNAMKWAVGNEVITGSNNKLNPKGNTTRAEAAAMIQKYCLKIGR